MAANTELMNQLDATMKRQAANVVAMEPPWKKNTDGGIKVASIVNAELAIEYDPTVSDFLAYNEFTWEVEVTRDVPELHIKKGQMLDAYTSLLLVELENVWGVVFSDRGLQHAVIALSREHSYNPLTDYLNHAAEVWDGTPRLDTFMNTFLGVAITPVSKLIVHLWFTGAVAKAFDPTIKFDYVLDLVGGQGAGKTTLLEKLAAGFYTDQFSDFKDKDGYQVMLRSWIVNDDEMTATANSTFEELKKFISARLLEFRPAYGHTSIRRDKGFVIARTSNERTYLKDKTGERRFLPLLVDIEQQKQHPVTDLTPEIVEQIWGEAMHLYHEGFSFGITPKQEQMLNDHRAQFMYVDAIEDEINENVEVFAGDFITSKQIGKLIGTPDLMKNRSVAKKIKYIMDNRADWKPSAKKINGVSKRGWKRV